MEDKTPIQENSPIREQKPIPEQTPIQEQSSGQESNPIQESIQHQEKTIPSRRGRPTKYTKETPRRVMHYIKKCQENNGFPTIERLAAELAIGTRTLYTWEAEYSDFRHTLEILRDVQRDQLIRGGLSNKYNARFAAFLLKANHGMQDKQPVVNATQNNTFNVSPELMADAIALVKEKDPSFMSEGTAQTGEEGDL